MSARAAACVFLVLVAAAWSGCGPRRLQLPSGDGDAFPSFLEASREATSSCRDARTISAELGISGRAGGQKLRGRATAGIAAPASIRLEGTAPFGPPVFILAAEGAGATLLLPRDNRVSIGDSPAAILDALVGLELGPGDLLAMLTGCVVANPQPVAGRQFSGDWARIALADGSSLYLQRDTAHRWKVRAGIRRDLRIEYETDGGGTPAALRVTVGANEPGATDLRFTLSQVDVNVPLGPEVFRVKVPADARPISLGELRQAGPMGNPR